MTYNPSGGVGPKGDKGDKGDPGSSASAFPVGSVFLSVVSTNPATLLGYGTWAGLGAGRVLVGVDGSDPDFATVEGTGGSKTVASGGSIAAPTLSGSTASESGHTHTYTDVVSHTHTVNVTDPGHTHTQNAHTHSTMHVQGGTTAATTGTHVMTSTATGGSSRATAAGEGADATTATNLSNTTGITAATVAPGGSVATGTTAAGSAHSHGVGTLTASAPSFTGSATSVVQPYLVVYMWKRTA